MARAIVITSGKGGVGKTTLTVNVGRILASMGLKVVLVDADMGLNNLDVVTGVLPTIKTRSFTTSST